MNSLLPGVVVFTLLILTLTVIVVRIRSTVLPSKQVMISINQQDPVSVKTGQKLLETLNGLNIPVPSGCAGAGTCGLCKVTVTAGGGGILPTEAARLSKADMLEGNRLACQVAVRADLSVLVPDHILNADHWVATVTSVKSLSPLIREFVFAMPSDASLDFHPGAYVQITSAPYSHVFADCIVDESEREPWDTLGISALSVTQSEPETRAYSLANKPAQNDRIVLLIRLALAPPSQMHTIPPGIVSSWLFGLKPGDKVDVSGPYGDFHLHENDRDMVLIGGGVGMAPLRSLIHHELASLRNRNVSFFYGARAQADMLYADELAAAVRQHPRFTMTVALSEPDSASVWDGPVGFIHSVFKQEFLDNHAHPERCDYYLCGPPMMQRAVLTVLDDAGVDLSTVYADVFGE